MARYTPEFLAAARHGYENTDQPMTALAADFGIGITTLQSLVRKHGWTQRSQRMRDSPPAIRLLGEAEALVASLPERGNASRAATPFPSIALSEGGSEAAAANEPAAASVPITATPAPTVPSLTPVERLEALVVKELEAEEAARAELALRPRSRHEAERCARTLSVLTQTLHTLQRMRAGGGAAGNSDDYDDIPEDMDAFRNELARRIRLFVESRREEEGETTEAKREEL